MPGNVPLQLAYFHLRCGGCASKSRTLAVGGAANLARLCRWRPMRGRRHSAKLKQAKKPPGRVSPGQRAGVTTRAREGIIGSMRWLVDRVNPAGGRRTSASRRAEDRSPIKRPCSPVPLRLRPGWQATSSKLHVNCLFHDGRSRSSSPTVEISARNKENTRVEQKAIHDHDRTIARLADNQLGLVPTSPAFDLPKAPWLTMCPTRRTNLRTLS